MQKRILGRTGLEVSVFGFGGIMLNNVPQKRADNIVREAVERGINYFDVGPTYGNAQQVMGPAIAPYRGDIVLACKTEPNLSGKEVTEEIKESLQLLQTDYFDVFQLHAVDDPENIDKALAPGGALEAIEEARRKGFFRFIGFSSHFEDSALTLLDNFDFDTVLFPINWACWLQDGKGKKVLEEAEKREIGRMAIKTLAQRSLKEDEDGFFPNTWYKPIFDDQKLASLALRFTLTKSIHLAISPGAPEMMRLGLDIIENEKLDELNKEELKVLKERATQNELIFDG